MASSPFNVSSVMMLVVVLVMVSLFVSPTCSLRVVDNHRSPKKGFRVDLRHVDSVGNYTKLQLLQRGIMRSKHRLARLNSFTTTRKGSSGSVQTPLYAGSGEFYMNIAIGTPPNSFRAIMDTGSDLIWTQCQPCTHCFRQPTPIFDPTKSSSFSAVSCSSKLCDALPTPSCDNGCEYMYSYADGSKTEGTLGTETFTFNQVSVPKVGFGCSNDNKDVGGGFSQGAGLVGLGGGPLSLVSQIGSGKFSYCLTPMGDIKPSSLLFGSLAKTKHGGNTKTTPLIRSPSQPTYYYLSLEGITVGSTRLSIPESSFALNEDGSGGVMIDSGTTLTYLEDSSYNFVKQAFIAQTRLPVANPGNTGLDLCFTVPSENYDIQVPTFIFHFKGADLELPAENIMISDSSMSQLVCLAMAPGGDMSIFGNIQQQNILVLYDIRKHKISFTPRNCDSL